MVTTQKDRTQIGWKALGRGQMGLNAICGAGPKYWSGAAWPASGLLRGCLGVASGCLPVPGQTSEGPSPDTTSKRICHHSLDSHLESWIL